MSPQMNDAEILRVQRWLGTKWLCRDCGRVLHKPNRVVDGERFHSMHCNSAMVSVRLDWGYR